MPYLRVRRPLNMPPPASSPPRPTPITAPPVALSRPVDMPPPGLPIEPFMPFGSLGAVTSLSCPGANAKWRGNLTLPVSQCPTSGWVGTYQLSSATARQAMLQSYKYWVSPAGVAQKAAIATVQQAGLLPTPQSYVPGAGAAAVKGVSPSAPPQPTATPRPAAPLPASLVTTMPPPPGPGTPPTPRPAPVLTPAALTTVPKPSPWIPPTPAPLPVNMPAPGTKEGPGGFPLPPPTAPRSVPTPVSQAVSQTGTIFGIPTTYLLLGGAAVAAYFLMSGDSAPPHRPRGHRP